MSGLEQQPNIDSSEQFTALVPSSGKLPHYFEVETGKFLDIVTAISSKTEGLSAKQKLKKELYNRLYNKTRPGFHGEFLKSLHFAYAEQPQGHRKAHHWRLFCDDGLREWLETFINETALTSVSTV